MDLCPIVSTQKLWLNAVQAGKDQQRLVLSSSLNLNSGDVSLRCAIRQLNASVWR